MRSEGKYMNKTWSLVLSVMILQTPCTFAIEADLYQCSYHHSQWWLSVVSSDGNMTSSSANLDEAIDQVSKSCRAGQTIYANDLRIIKLGIYAAEAAINNHNLHAVPIPDLAPPMPARPRSNLAAETEMVNR
jgi:hypothetical protein